VTSIAGDARLADAAEKQDRATVRTLLKQHADVNAPQPDGMTALHWAAYLDDLETAKLLAKAGADVKATNAYGVTPLSLACINGNAALVALLLDAGADPNTTMRGGESVLMTAARTGKPSPVKLLLARSVDVNAKERRGQTALIWAAADGHAEVGTVEHVAAPVPVGLVGELFGGDAADSQEDTYDGKGRLSAAADRVEEQLVGRQGPYGEQGNR